MMRFTSWDGRSVELPMEDDGESAFLVESVDGLIAVVEDRVSTAAGSDGQVLEGQDVGGMPGTLQVSVMGEDAVDLDRRWRWFRTLWHTKRQGTLSTETQAGQFHARARSQGVLPLLPKLPSGAAFVTQPVPLIVDKGLWWSEMRSGTGSVTVTNWGDAVIHPRIRWRGNSRKLTLPSGLVISLPNTASTAAGERVLVLDDDESLAVLDPAGVLDRSRWPVSGAVAEGVPPGESRVYVTSSAEVFVEWFVPIFDPWK